LGLSKLDGIVLEFYQGVAGKIIQIIIVIVTLSIVMARHPIKSSLSIHWLSFHKLETPNMKTLSRVIRVKRLRQDRVLPEGGEEGTSLRDRRRKAPGWTSYVSGFLFLGYAIYLVL
jgi:hypothetical protein